MLDWRLVAYGGLVLAGMGCTRTSPKPHTTEAGAEGPNVGLLSNPDIKLALPRAQYTLELVDTPLIVITPTNVYLTSVDSTTEDPRRVASTVEYERRPQFDRILFDELQAARQRWVNAHPGEPFPPVVTIAADRQVSFRAVVTAFYTAALAGYPNISFQVLGPERKLRRLATDAWLPGHRPSSRNRILLADVQGDTVTLRWRERDGKVKAAGSLRLAELPSRAKQIYATEGKHRDPNDKEWDLVFIWAPDATMDQLAKTLDGFSAARRKFRFRGVVDDFPAFRLILKMGEIPTNKEASTILPIDADAAAAEAREEMSEFGFVPP